MMGRDRTREFFSCTEALKNTHTGPIKVAAASAESQPSRFSCQASTISKEIQATAMKLAELARRESQSRACPALPRALRQKSPTARPTTALQ